MRPPSTTVVVCCCITHGCMYSGIGVERIGCSMQLSSACFFSMMLLLSCPLRPVSGWKCC